MLYHELREAESRYSYVVERAAFERQVELFARVRAADGPGLRPEITFDDGHVSNYGLALPVLVRHGMTARFFITAGWTGRKAGYMSWDELRALHAAGQAIGAHGWSHTLLTHCDAAGLRVELGDARRALEDGLGEAVTTMSLPGGRYNERVMAACGEAGYTQVFTSVPKAEPVPAGVVVGRLNIVREMKLEWIAKLLEAESRTLRGLERSYRVKATAKRVLGDRVYAKVWAVLNRQESVEAEGGEGGIG